MTIKKQQCKHKGKNKSTYWLIGWLLFVV
jgi:hypothetical protein